MKSVSLGWIGGTGMKQHFFRFVLLCAVLCTAASSVLLTAHGTDSEESLQERVEKSMNVSVMHTGHKERVIQCFDVNENGWFAVGYGVNIIHIFDQNGTFQYGYRFDCDSGYGITFHGNLLGFYLIRSETMAYFDPAGNCVSAEKVDLSTEERNALIYRVNKQVGNTQYALERDIGLFDGDYSRLVATDALGNRNVLYDVTVLGYFLGAFHYIILLFPFVCIALVKIKLEKEEA